MVRAPGSPMLPPPPPCTETPSVAPLTAGAPRNALIVAEPAETPVTGTWTLLVFCADGDRSGHGGSGAVRAQRDGETTRGRVRRKVERHVLSGARAKRERRRREAKDSDDLYRLAAGPVSRGRSVMIENRS